MFHNKCGNGVAIDITLGFKIICSAGISRKSLTAGIAQIVPGTTEIPTKYFCQTCNANVSKAELYFVCAQCSAKITSEESYIVHGAGGIYCKEHAETNASLSSPAKKCYVLDPILDTVAVP